MSIDPGGGVLKTACAIVLLLISAVMAQSTNALTDSQRCERVAQLKIANTTINARLVAAGAFTAPGAPPPAAIADRYRSLPQFCRVTAHAHPSNDSDIVIEVWLPASGWNERFQAIGTGGFAGVIPYPNLATVLKRGYATASTDTGHATGANAEWAFGHPEKVIDYGYRGVHEMTSVAKLVINSFYGNNAQHSYFVGCSNGGRQALMEAQRYPDDYDGILAGAPANNWTRLLTSALWSMQALGDPESYIPAAKWKAVEAAVNNACDANDGVKDGILNDPRQCRFDPATIQCKPGDADNACLTAKQAIALTKIYQGAQDANGRRIFFGLLPGAESRQNGWESWISGEALGKSFGFFFGTEYFRNMVYHDRAWDYHSANIDAALKAADERTGRALNATDPDLSKLAKHGGKVILYHGWNDPAIPATSTVDYYDAVQRKMGADTQKFARLYMVPGMQHCGDGPGATSIGGNVPPFEPDRNILSALEQWVEKGVAPETLMASKPGSTMTRPLCPYPQSARYNGTGDVNTAASFTCTK